MNTEAQKKTPRGVRNNNPLNIVRSKSAWQGQKQVITDKRFCEFESMAYGWRAAFYLLTKTYYHRYGLSSIQTIIARWAPKEENDVDAYVSTVSKLMNYDPNISLGVPLMHPTRWLALGLAMAYVENGVYAFDYFEMLKGWEMLYGNSHYD